MEKQRLMVILAGIAVVMGLLAATAAPLLAQPPAAPAGGQQASPPGPGQPGPQNEFVPIKQLPEQEKLAAAPLLITAYAFVWAVLLVYVWTVWRRLGRVETEMKDLSARLSGRTGSRG